jgi:hypothetical protein
MYEKHTETKELISLKMFKIKVIIETQGRWYGNTR